MPETHVAYVLSKEDETRRLVFAVEAVPVEKILEIENRTEAAPYVVATRVMSGLFFVDRDKPPHSQEFMVPSSVVEEAVDIDVGQARKALAAADAKSVGGWRGVAQDGSCFVLVAPKDARDTDMATMLKAFLGGTPKINRIYGGSYPTDDRVSFGVEPRFGETYSPEMSIRTRM